MRIKKAVVIATENGRQPVPTEMIPLIDRPIIQYIMDELSCSGIEEVLIVLGDNSDSFMRHFEASGYINNHSHQMSYKHLAVYFSKYPVYQDYGGAILSARTFVGDEAFALINATQFYYGSEEPAMYQIVEAYKYMRHSILGLKAGTNLCEALDAQLDEEEYYNIANLNYDESVGIEKTDSLKGYSLCGRSILRPEIFSYLSEFQEKSFGRKSYILALNQMRQDQKVYGVLVKGSHYDLNTYSGYVKSVIDLALQHGDLKEEIRDYMDLKLKLEASL